MPPVPGRPDVVLHIGTHKTGTTAFQRYCLEHRAWLEMQGVKFYVHPTGAPQAHELPLLALRRELTIPLRVRNPDWTLDEALEEMRGSITSTLGAAGSLQLFSHEALSFVREDAEVAVLRSLFEEVEVHVVVMLRRPADYLESWKRQLERMGFQPTSRHQTSFQYTEPDSWLVDYERLIDVYRTGFGDDRITVLDYDAAVDADGSVVPVLLEACGIGRSALPAGWQVQRNRRDEPSGF